MKKYLLLLISLLLSFISNSQNSADVAQNFGAYTGFNSSITVITTQSDGKILLGGSFNVFKGVGESKIIRLNADGSKDNSFTTGIGTNAGFDSTVSSIELQSDGKILVGGGFQSYKGVTENRIIRLNSDGSKDDSFITGTGFNSAPETIALQADGKIIIGGNFTTYKGITENRIIRLNPDGTKDSSFITGTGFIGSIGSGSKVSKILLQSDGKIIIIGSFTSYKGITENGIIRLNSDGSKDISFITGTGFNNTPNTIALQSDGKILVGGAFNTYKGITENRIIRLNSDGSKDTSFITGTGFNITPGTIACNSNKIVLQSDGKIILGGSFTSYKGVTENRIIRLNPDGSKDASFITGTGFGGVSKSVYDIALQSDGKILIGGDFYSYQGVNEMFIIRLNIDGSKHISFNTGNGFIGVGISKIATQTDGKLLVGGNFTSYQGVNKIGLCRLNIDGSLDTSFNSGTGFKNTSYDDLTSISSIAVQNDGKILVGGTFNYFNGVVFGSIIRLNNDGSVDNSFSIGTGFDQTVFSIALQSDGKILVGGAFTNYTGITENGIIRLNSDGTKDTSFITGTGFEGSFGGFVYDIALQNDGKILVGGNFTTYKGITANRIIRLNSDGSLDTSFITGTGANIGFNQAVWELEIQNDGRIFVGGIFTTYKGQINNNYIIRLNTDGSKDTSFITGTGFNLMVEKVAIQNDGKIVVGGWFSSYKGITANRIIRLNTDGSNDTSFVTGTGFNISNGNSTGNVNQPVRDIIIQNDGKILVGGDFYTYKDSNESSLLIKLYGNANLETEIFNDSKAFIVYPNPSSNFLFINSSLETNYSLFSILGKQVVVGNLSQGENTIDTSALSSGIYFLKINTTKGTEKFKIIIE